MALDREKKKILALCVFAYTVSYLCRTNLSLAMEPLMADLSVTALDLSFVSTIYFWMYASGQLIGGFLATRNNPKMLLIIGFVLTGTLNLLISLSNTIFAITLFWGLNGLSLALFWPSIVQICSKKFTDQEYAKISMIMNLPTTMGYFLSWLTFGNIAAAGQWKPLFVVPGIIAYISIFIWAFTDLKIQPSSVPAEKVNKRNNDKLSVIIIEKTMIAFGIIVMLEGATRESMNLWAPTLVKDRMTGNPEFLSVFLSLIPLFTTAGLLITKHFLKNMDERRNNLVAGTLVVISCVSAGMMYICRNSFIIFLLFYAIALASIYAGASFIVTLVPLRISITGQSAMISGILNFMAYVGASLGILLSGYVSSSFGMNAIYILWMAFSIIPVLLLPIILKKNN